ncbi:TatD family hydrolase [Ectothiorhodospira haloalkaliphila]|uniref:TatD family hydrolase n=1 Tax=Ectothiorhodospira haloalkaliphila TaxID=421628 RepID=UPI001EE7A593|nr:TatD family hydrolase [Ectothiorhodospira haloalkaliphila]MCG5524811.1 TatD family hydrolase [Ectothiorhodospira haloalkaliphila]
MLIDSHCHLDRIDLKPFDGDRDRMMQAAAEAGVDHMLCVCIDMNNYAQVKDLAARYEQVSCSVGVHPSARDGHEPSEGELVAMAGDPGVVAIGETGLDYHYNEGDLEWQRARFRRHLRAARAAGKPVIIHTRDARRDTLDILKEEGVRDTGGVLHCFTEDWDTAHAGLDMGLYVSFSGIVTFRNAQALRDVARQVPDDRLLVETDAPYLAPMPYRGKTNHPAWVRHVAECLADVRGVPLERLAEQTTANYGRLFGVPAHRASRSLAGVG